VLNFNKHGGKRGKRHDLCHFPTIVLYRAVKVPSESAESVPDIIILKGNNSTPLSDSRFSNLINPFQSSTPHQDAGLRFCLHLYLCFALSCPVTHCTGGRGCYQVIVIIIIIIISISISIIIIALISSGVVFL
jgi:hypothetical protein